MSRNQLADAIQAVAAANRDGLAGGGPDSALPYENHTPSRKSSTAASSRYDHYYNNSHTPDSLRQMFRDAPFNFNNPNNQPKKRALMPGKGKDWKDKKGGDVPWKATFCGRDNKKKKRAMVIEYIRSDVEEDGKRVTQMEAKVREIGAMVELEAVASVDRKEGTILRVYHVQNFPEAISFLMEKYKMNNRSVGWPGIKEWLYHRAPERRANKPVPMAHAFPKIVTTGVSKAAWSMDVMKTYPVDYRDDSTRRYRHQEAKIAELNGYFDDDETSKWTPDDPWKEGPSQSLPHPPASTSDTAQSPSLAQHVKDVYSQRLSCYVQWVNDAEGNSTRHGSPFVGAPKRRQASDVTDLGNTIIIFDNSESLSIDDTIIPAHGEEERLWRGPGTSRYTPEDDEDENDEVGANGEGAKTDKRSHDQKYSVDYMHKIIETIFQAVGKCWEVTLEASWDHVSILQDRIYAQPADESRAGEMFRDSSLWLALSKLMTYHRDCLEDVQEALGNFREEDQSGENGTRQTYDWLATPLAIFDRMDGYINNDLITSSDKLQDLLYKSVGIRDSRASLILSESMWRLSWITFIFLPLTAVAGIFGMNVDSLKDNPPSWYYAASSLGALFGVWLFWYVFKHKLTKDRRSFTTRGNYERLFQELSRTNADLWSTHGPRVVKPKGFFSSIKWKLMVRWTKNKALSKTPDLDDDSQWTRAKKHLIKRWTSTVKFEHIPNDLFTWEKGAEDGYHGLDQSHDHSHLSEDASMRTSSTRPRERRDQFYGPSVGPPPVKAYTEPIHGNPGNISQISLNNTSEKDTTDSKDSTVRTSTATPSSDEQQRSSTFPTENFTDVGGGIQADKPEDLAYEQSSSLNVGGGGASSGFRRKLKRVDTDRARQFAMAAVDTSASRRSPAQKIYNHFGNFRPRGRRTGSSNNANEDSSSGASATRAQTVPAPPMSGDSDDLYSVSPEDVRPPQQQQQQAQRGKVSRRNTGSSVRFADEAQAGDEGEHQPSGQSSTAQTPSSETPVSAGGGGFGADIRTFLSRIPSPIAEADSIKKTS